MNGVIAGIAAAGLAVGGLAWLLARLVGAARARYRHLLAAVELLQRQATELRSEVDGLGERLQRIDDRLATSLQPLAQRLGRALEIEQAAEQVRGASGEGSLAPETARRLLFHLALLGDSNVGEDPSC
jgi:hypothetical protein